MASWMRGNTTERDDYEYNSKAILMFSGDWSGHGKQPRDVVEGKLGFTKHCSILFSFFFFFFTSSPQNVSRVRVLTILLFLLYSL